MKYAHICRLLFLSPIEAHCAIKHTVDTKHFFLAFIWSFTPWWPSVQDTGSFKTVSPLSDESRGLSCGDGYFGFQLELFASWYSKAWKVIYSCFCHCEQSNTWTCALPTMINSHLKPWAKLNLSSFKLFWSYISIQHRDK